MIRTLGLDLGPLIAGAGIVGVVVYPAPRTWSATSSPASSCCWRTSTGSATWSTPARPPAPSRAWGCAPPGCGTSTAPLAHPQRRDPPGRQPLPGLGPGPGGRGGSPTPPTSTTPPDHRAGRPRAVRRRALGAQDPGAAGGLGGRGPRPRRHPGPGWRPRPAPGAVEGGPRAAGPPQVAFDRAGIAVSAQKALTADSQGQPAA